MRKIRVGLDVDGIVADFHGAHYAETIRRYGVYTPETAFKTSAAVLEDGNRSFWTNLQPLVPHHKVEFLMEHVTYNKDSTLYFITKRPTCLHNTTSTWLKHYLYEFMRLDIDPVCISGCVEKSHVAAGLLLDYFVDDDPIHCLQTSCRAPNTRVFLQSRPYNTWFDATGTKVEVLEDEVNTNDA